MGLWSAFGELWGWLSDEKPDGADVFPPIENTALNGGCDEEGAAIANLNFLDLTDPETSIAFSEAVARAMEEEGLDDDDDWWEEEDNDDEEDSD
jgi:hypothetical protein